MKKPPRLIVRTLTVVFVTVAVILSIVFMILMVDTRERVRAAEIEKLRVAEQVFTSLEARRQQEQLAAMTTLAENPTLKAALDTYFTESRFAALAAEQEASLRETVTLEADKLARLTGADALVIVDPAGKVFVSTGPSRDRWPRGHQLDLTPGAPTFQAVISLPQGAFRISGAALRLVDRDIGALVLATSLDLAYARELSALANADVVITIERTAVASTLPGSVTATLADDPTAGVADTVTLGDEEYAVRRLVESGAARIYTLASIDAAARAATRAALMEIGRAHV